MKNVKVLDCTLRDGGRIIDCKFSDSQITNISEKLATAKIDIIEVGFLRDNRRTQYEGNSTFFTEISQVNKLIKKENNSNIKYVMFVDYGMFDISQIVDISNNVVSGIRFGFTKDNLSENRVHIINSIKHIKQKGYEVYVQPVNILNYSDREIIELIEIVNQLDPYAFAIVDTYGAMYLDDFTRIYSFVEHNLRQSISIDIHSHNNFQLSFAIAQEAIKLSKGTRNIIIDATLNGMGKCAGNLNTELIVDYLNKMKEYDYELDILLDIIDEYLYAIKEKHFWGYSIPAFMAGVYKSHPNNIIYLTEKFRMDTKDVKNIISMIDEEKRQQYDYDNIEQIYITYSSSKNNDYETVKYLKGVFDKRKVLILVPGNSLVTEKDKIEEFIKNEAPVIISVNFVSNWVDSLSFWGNKKRYNQMKNSIDKKKSILVSNINSTDLESYVVDYNSLINRGYKYFDNSALMLLNLLRRMEISDIHIAGFDGLFNEKDNYIDDTFDNDRKVEEFSAINREIFLALSDYYKKVKEKCSIRFLTLSIFEEAFKN
jgi:4-hydroxy 2-oxovalerate aldolase